MFICFRLRLTVCLKKGQKCCFWRRQCCGFHERIIDLAPEALKVFWVPNSFLCEGRKRQMDSWQCNITGSSWPNGFAFMDNCCRCTQTPIPVDKSMPAADDYENWFFPYSVMYCTGRRVELTAAVPFDSWMWSSFFLLNRLGASAFYPALEW